MVAHEFFGIGWGELMLLIVLAVIFFGPEKLPELSRKAARIIYALRVFANQATSQLKEELGPEYQDLTLADLNPKTFVQKTLLGEMQGDLDEIKKDLDGVKSELTGSASELGAAGSSVKSLVNASLTNQAPVGTDTVGALAAAGPTTADKASMAAQLPPWDDEAT